MSGKAIHITDYSKQIPGALNDDATAWEFPPVDSVNANGRATRWQISVRIFVGEEPLPIPESDFIEIRPEYFSGRHDAIKGWINVQSGVVGGKIRDTVPTIVAVGKNIGKANETNPFTQSLRDALGIYNKQLKKAIGGGAPSTSAASSTPTLYPPMLAQVLKDQKKPPVPTEAAPVYVQRKYNGVRTVTTMDNGRVIMYSRRKNLYPGFGYIKAECATILEKNPGLYLDGEIYAHGVPLQDISGHARREDSPEDPRFKYMVYDCFDPARPDLKFSERAEILRRELGDGYKFVVRVETFTATSISECERLYRGFVAEGYEGAMVRVDAPYEYSYNERHSKVLLKMKPTYDAEFPIVGWTTGEKGKAAAALMIICGVGDGEFPVTPTGEITMREALAKKFGEVEANGKTHFENHWKGRPLIVYYDELSKDGVPQRARTDLVIRNEI